MENNLELKKNLTFFTLLYIDTNHKSLAHNGISGDFDKQMEIFIGCCNTLNESLKFFTGIELVILTNNSTYINKVNNKLKCQNINFALDVPKGIKFFSAHFKLEALKYLSLNLEEEGYGVLLDSDICCVNKMPRNFINCINNNIPIYYDITDVLFTGIVSDGRDEVLETKKILDEDFSSVGLWAGGEIIGGDCHYFKKLCEEVEKLKEKYFETYSLLFHQGDETIVSLAVEKLMRVMYICDIGRFGGIVRYWSLPILHIQLPFKAFKNVFLLHLPGDKKYLARLKTFDNRLIERYKSYLRIKMMYPRNIYRSIRHYYRLWTR